MALRASDLRGIAAPIGAIVIDIPAQEGHLTLAAFADDTTSLYVSTGGATIGAGNLPPVAEATRRLLLVAAAQSEDFAEADVGAWPESGTVRMHLVSGAGNRFVDLPESEFWGREQGVLSPLVEAAQEVVRAIRLVQEAQSSQAGGVTRLMAAAQHDDVPTLAELVAHGARLDAQDEKGNTALMYAANAGHLEAVRILLAEGADPNATDGRSNTALMFAAQGGSTEMVRALLGAGADPTLRGDHGLTALGFAQQNGHSESVELLAEAGASD